MRPLSPQTDSAVHSTARSQPGSSGFVRWLYRLPVLLALALLLLRYVDLPHLVRPGARIPLAAMQLTTLDGAPLPPALTHGRVVVLNYWAPWCGPCRAEMPSLNALMRQSHGRVVVVGVLDDPATVPHATAFLRIHDLSYPVVQLSPALTQAVGAVHLLPTTLYLSPSGRVMVEVSGYTPGLLMRLYAWRAGRA